MNEIERKMVKFILVGHLGELEKSLERFCNNTPIDAIEKMFKLLEEVEMPEEGAAAYKAMAVAFYQLKLSADQAKDCATKAKQAVEKNM